MQQINSIDVDVYMDVFVLDLICLLVAAKNAKVN